MGIFEILGIFYYEIIPQVESFTGVSWKKYKRRAKLQTPVKSRELSGSS